MTDSITVLPPGWRATDANDAPSPGAVLKFFAATTSTPLNVYSDNTLTTSLGSQITCDSGGYPTSDGSTKVLVYTGSAAYKIRGEDAAGALLWQHDSVRGQTATVTSLTTALPKTPVVSKSANYTIVTADQGKLFDANSTGGAFVLTLPSAVTVGDGWRVGIHMVGTANTVTIASVSTQGIAGPAKSVTSFALTAYGEVAWLVSNGATWDVEYGVGNLRPNTVVLNITSRITALPGSPVAGSRYIVTTAFSTYSTGAVLESDGSGGWTTYTPAAGWIAYVVAESLYTAYSGTAWVDQTGMVKAAQITPVAVFEHQGASSGVPTSSAWTTRTLNTQVSNTITGMSLAANEITFPVGTFLVTARQNTATTGYSSATLQQRLNANTATVTMQGDGVTGRRDSSSGGTQTNLDSLEVVDTFVITVTVAGTIRLQYYSVGNNTLGAAGNGTVNVYARLTVQQLNFTA